jgi:hypothetical protein
MVRPSPRVRPGEFPEKGEHPMAKQVTFLMPEGEHEQLVSLRPRNPDNQARDIVREYLYRARRREQHIAFKKRQRNAEAFAADERARNAGV